MQVYRELFQNAHHKQQYNTSKIIANKLLTTPSDYLSI